MRDWGETAIRVTVKSPSIGSEAENKKVLEACYGYAGLVKFRLNVGSYGPGTVEKPTPRFWWMLGESATVECRDVEVGNWFRGELMKWLKSLDGVVLEVADE